MANQDSRIDAYIARAQPFARPILERIRKAVHTACPILPAAPETATLIKRRLARG